MIETEAKPYVSPMERLNETLAAPKETLAAKDFRGEVAKEVFVTGLREILSKPKDIAQESLKILAVISVDAADILIKQLAK